MSSTPRQFSYEKHLDSSFSKNPPISQSSKSLIKDLAVEKRTKGKPTLGLLSILFADEMHSKKHIVTRSSCTPFPKHDMYTDYQIPKLVGWPPQRCMNCGRPLTGRDRSEVNSSDSYRYYALFDKYFQQALILARGKTVGVPVPEGLKAREVIGKSEGNGMFYIG